jgi:hypothetical protein
VAAAAARPGVSCGGLTANDFPSASGFKNVVAYNVSCHRARRVALDYGWAGNCEIKYAPRPCTHQSCFKRSCTIVGGWRCGYSDFVTTPFVNCTRGRAGVKIISNPPS